MALRFIKNLIEGSVQEQPAGIDLTVWKLYRLSSSGMLGVGDRRLPETVEVGPENGLWRLNSGAYKVVYNEVVSIPEDHIGLCFPRSSLLRMGATVECAVWDPGYTGRGSSLLLVFNPSGIVLERNSRIVQLVLVRVQERPRKTYSGVYQHENL